MSIKRLLVIVGPTGSGKTDLSIRIACRYGAPILSTDSRQFYRGMPVGTAQPTAEQLQAAEHHFIADREIDRHLNCGAYEAEALARLEALFATHDIVVAVGGSGLYVRALCEGMDDLPPADEALRERLNTRLREEGIESLADELKRLDPAYWEQVDRSNPARVLRALEVCLQTGRPYSSLRTGRQRTRPFAVTKIGIDLPRPELYARIDRRVELMIGEGLEEEARRLYPFRHLTALQTVGYREFFEYFDGHITRDEAIELIKRNSRRYAKRQLTWFRRDPAIRWFAPNDDRAILDYIDSTAAVPAPPAKSRSPRTPPLKKPPECGSVPDAPAMGRGCKPEQESGVPARIRLGFQPRSGSEIAAAGANPDFGTRIGNGSNAGILRIANYFVLLPTSSPRKAAPGWWNR